MGQPGMVVRVHALRMRTRPLGRPTRHTVWSHLKRSLASLTKHNLSQLTALVKTRPKRMQYRPGLLGGFLTSTGLDSHPLLSPP